MREVKVFGIGLQKTGTSSLGVALEMLGYRVCAFNFANQVEQEFGAPLTSALIAQPNFREQALELAKRNTENYDAFEDFPWFVYYKEMDRLYPNSKFILTLRDPDTWVGSMRAFDTTYRIERAQVVLEWIYGVAHPSQNEEHYKAFYHKHVAEVREHFRNRPGALLELSMGERGKMRQLCKFLDQPRPRKLGIPLAYPHKNIGRRNRLINLSKRIKTRFDVVRTNLRRLI